jgi:hypothetical protein
MTDPQSSSGSAREIVEHYISIVAHRVRVLTKRLEDSGQPAYASSGAATLSTILLRILSRFFDELKALQQEVGSQPPEDVIRQVRTIHYITVAIVPEHIEAIRVANSNSPAASILEAYEHVGNMVQYGTQTIIHPTWEYNASFDEIMTTLKAMTMSLRPETGRAIFSGAPPRFVIITYPIAEEEMVLRHALIAHEIGHLIDLVEKWSKLLLEEKVFEKEDYDSVHQAVQGPREGGDDVLTPVLEIVGAITPSWIQEITADFLATCVLGPAYLLAFDEVSLTPNFSSPGRLSRSHPPPQLRKEIMGKLVKELYLDPVRSRAVSKRLSRKEQDVLDSACGWIDTIVHTGPAAFTSIDDASDLAPEIIAVIYAVLSNAVRRAIAELRKNHLEKIKGRKWFCTSGDVVDALRLQELLSHGLTPTELYLNPSRDPSFPAVMNSGWFHFLHEKEHYLYFSDGPGRPDPDQVRDRYVNLQNLVAKAVESLHFKREYQRQRGPEREEIRA